MSPPLLEIEDVDVFYGPIQALRRISLVVHEGERIALVGANGAGKTTTLRAVSGVVPAARGRLAYRGRDLRRCKPAHIVGLGISHLPEGRELFAGLSVEENLRAGFWSQRRSGASYVERRDAVMAMFPILGERAAQPAGTLSGGEQQMLGVARALMSNPQLLLVDELSLGLAPKIVTQLFAILEEINRAGTAVVVVEQFVHMALAHTDRAYVLAKGEVVLEGPSRAMLSDPTLVASYLGDTAVDVAPRARRRRAPTRQP